MAFLTREEIKVMGFREVGDNVYLSNKASYYNCKNISIGSNTRVDDFALLSAGDGGIEIGCYVHIAAFCTLIGAKKIVLRDFSGLSSRVSIYSSSDDYSGEFMTNPMVPDQFTNVIHGEVSIGKHVIVGSGTVILPNVNLEDGVAVGALSLVIKDCKKFSIYSGVPAIKKRDRKKNILELEKNLLNKSHPHP